jgi:hypothetical protein
VFSGIWAKVTTALTAVVVILAAAIKFKSAENSRLQREIKVKDKKEEIRKDQIEAKNEILEEEKQRVKDTNKSGSRADRLNRL